MTAKPYQEIIAACFPDLQIASCAVVSQGWDSVAVLVNGELIFRFPKRPDVEPQYLKETRLLAELADLLPLPVPRFTFVWAGGAAYDHAFIGYRLLDGTPLTAAHLTAGTTERVAEQLAAFLSALHHFPTQQAAQQGIPNGDLVTWQQRYRTMYERIQAQIFPLLDSTAQSRIAADWDAFLSDATPFQPALIHNDLTGDHILFGPQRGAVSGIIDWGDAMIGDPAVDFAGLLHDYGAGFVERVLVHYTHPVDTTFRQRAAFYERIVPFHEVLFGQETGLEEHVRQGLRDLRERLEIRD